MRSSAYKTLWDNPGLLQTATEEIRREAAKVQAASEWLREESAPPQPVANTVTQRLSLCALLFKPRAHRKTATR
jgi:hypothetical protein